MTFTVPRDSGFLSLFFLLVLGLLPPLLGVKSKAILITQVSGKAYFYKSRPGTLMWGPWEYFHGWFCPLQLSSHLCECKVLYELPVAFRLLRAAAQLLLEAQWWRVDLHHGSDLASCPNPGDPSEKIYLGALVLPHVQNSQIRKLVVSPTESKHTQFSEANGGLVQNL